MSSKSDPQPGESFEEYYERTGFLPACQRLHDAVTEAFAPVQRRLERLVVWVAQKALLTFLWVPFHDRPGSGGQRPPRVRSAMAISASGLW